MKDFWYKLFHAPDTVFYYDSKDEWDRTIYEKVKKAFKETLKDKRRFLVEYDDENWTIKVWRKDPTKG